jgi:monofunctional chorismate mutase
MSTLEILRTQIDEIDDQLLKLLIKRLSIVENIGKIKENSKLPVQDLKREAAILKRINELAPSNNKECITELFQHIIRYCKDHQAIKRNLKDDCC